METTTNAEGDDELKKLISVSLRPDDPFAKRLLSTPVRTNNLLIKVTVPKRTGRKRKRGTTGPFLTEDEIALTNKTYVDAPTIYRSLQDNASTYKVALAGVVDETHRFRSESSTVLNSVEPSLTLQICPTCSMLLLTTRPWWVCETTSCQNDVRLIPTHSKCH